MKKVFSILGLITLGMFSGLALSYTAFHNSPATVWWGSFVFIFSLLGCAVSLVLLFAMILKELTVD